MQELIIVGAGGHSKVVADMAMLAGFKVLGFVDDYVSNAPFAGYDIIGAIRDIKNIIKQNPTAKIILAIGDNNVRMKVANELVQAPYATVIHPSAIISCHAEIGSGTVIMPNVVINAFARIGEHVILNTSCSVDHDCQIGNFSHLSPGVHLSGGVIVGEGAHLGTGSCVIPGIKIGSWSVIGAGAVVTRDIPPRVVAVGVPAKVIRSID